MKKTATEIGVQPSGHHTVVLDLSALDLNAFWTVLDHKSLVYPFDAKGRRRDLPQV
jgi:hypothetical protein